MKLASLLLITALALSAGPPREFLVISDIHFNPLADPALTQQLMASEPTQWEAIFTGDLNQPLQKYGDDSAWPLLSALITGIRDVQPRPKIVFLTGDILTHKFREKFVAAENTKDHAAFRSFVKKTFAFVSFELEKAAGGVPVVYTLGNNDEECGDYALQPSGPFLQDTSGHVRALAHLSAGDLTGWMAYGSYTMPNPIAVHHRIIALNTNFWSRRYTNTCGSQSDDPGQTVLDWLSGQLKEAQRGHEKVWLVYHIPPGIDGHSSSRANQTVPMWKQNYAEGFNKLLDEYRKTIDLNLAGHTHLDDIRLVKTPHATTLVLINPGVSPNVGQNPAFRVFEVDSRARLIDLMTYYIPRLENLKWQLEYRARSAYNLKHLNAKSYESLYRQIDGSSTVADKWKLYYSVSRPAGLSDRKAYLQSLYCATGNSDPESYEACLNSSQK